MALDLSGLFGFSLYYSVATGFVPDISGMNNQDGHWVYLPTSSSRQKRLLINTCNVKTTTPNPHLRVIAHIMYSRVYTRIISRTDT